MPHARIGVPLIFVFVNLHVYKEDFSPVYLCVAVRYLSTMTCWA
jgi:hypothetical protein